MKKEYSVDLELFDDIKHTSILYVQGDSEVYPLTINLRKHGMPFRAAFWLTLPVSSLPLSSPILCFKKRL